MAIVIRTSNAQEIIDKINADIASGAIETWDKDPEKQRYTHHPEQWKNLAWFEPKTTTTDLVFNLKKGKKDDKDIPLTRQIYSTYHGRFIEMLISHLSAKWILCGTSSSPENINWDDDELSK